MAKYRKSTYCNWNCELCVRYEMHSMQGRNVFYIGRHRG